ncbi:MAG: hypothetical protein K2N75_08280 [Helicobacter sp.]|uniref:hypothetical protein n=1 Tax=Helicobacter sp. TaxID=218 RepID=UPI0023C7B43D|nr:hypothetical protein [Helicobacter sp.]MDE5926272.1 hypothetical protein [Helicobacter sp.]MDE7176017.1 hypothetical protein [Helicobacter sp.]
MNVNDKNQSMWGLLNQSYTQQNTKSNNISGYSNDSNSLFSTQNTQNSQGIDAISNLFNVDSSNNKTIITEIQDSFEISAELSNLQNFAQNFSAKFENNFESLKDLGDAMLQSGILNNEEKVGFDVLQKFNPSLDSAQTQNILQNTNLSQENKNLLNQVDRKISAIRYFGGF